MFSPTETPNRWLILHPESDCYFEVHSAAELESALRGGECVDVTGDCAHETLFIHYQQLRANHEGTDSALHAEDCPSLSDPDSDDEGEEDQRHSF